MRTAPYLLGLLLLGAPVVASEKAMTPTDPVSAAARFTAPAGWHRDTGSFGADHFVTFSSGTLRIRVQLLGVKGSRYATSEAFLAGPEAKSVGKTGPAKRTEAGGRTFKVYKRVYEAATGDPGAMAGGTQTVEERYTIVPAGKTFFVLSYTRRNETPVEAPLNLAPWTRFLGSFKPR